MNMNEVHIKSLNCLEWAENTSFRVSKRHDIIMAIKIRINLVEKLNVILMELSDV